MFAVVGLLNRILVNIRLGFYLVVVGTVIKPVTFDPTLENLKLLILMIIIRTIIGWTIALELNSRWTSQRP